jgi:hypothetical protein
VSVRQRTRGAVGDEPAVPRPRLAVAWLLTSLAVLAGTGLAVVTDDPAPPRGATVPPPAVGRPASAPLPEPTGPQAQRHGARPVAVALPALDLRTRVVPVGVTRDGVMALPDARRVGWYRHGASPGTGRGSAVLAGHVDSREVGLGALVRLRESRAGDRVVVTRADGSRVPYRVVRVVAHAKAALPLASLFRRGGAPVLRVVTCGGSFSPEAGGYEENVVVTAVPAGSA